MDLDEVDVELMKRPVVNSKRHSSEQTNNHISVLLLFWLADACTRNKES